MKRIFLNYIGKKPSINLIQKIGKRISNGVVYQIVCIEVSVKKSTQIIVDQIYVWGAKLFLKNP